MRLLFPSLILSIALPCLAQISAEDEFVCNKNGLPLSQTAPLVNKIQDAYQKVSTLKAKFIQSSYLSALDTSETSSGDVIFTKPGRMKWHYKIPEVQDFLVREETLWFYQPAEKQVTIDSLDRVLLSDLPVGFLMGLGDLSKEFTVTEACAGKSGTIVSFAPKSADANKAASEQLSQFRLLVDQKTYLPKGAQVLDISRNQTTIILNDLAANEAIAESQFATIFPKGTDTTDRRTTHNRG